MATNVDKLAQVHPNAQLGDGCFIGPYCSIGENVSVGANTRLRAHVYVDKNTTIGSDCDVFPYVTLGVESQDQKYVQGTATYTRIGDRNTIREFVSVHAGTQEHSTTSVGSDCVMLAHSHVAHNCEVGDFVVLSHSATLGGHVVADDYANIGGLSAVHQYCRVGRAAMVAGMSRMIQDVLPFTIAEGFPAHMRIINKVGMQRAGYSAEQIGDARKVFRMLFMREMRLEVAVEQVLAEFPGAAHVNAMVDAVRASQRGLARPDSAAIEINSSE